MYVGVHKVNRENLEMEHCRSRSLGNVNTHPVDEALQKPFGGVNPRCHLLLVLWGKSE